jgi:pimeloyl-ACP methyl ester carboxylesterase
MATFILIPGSWHGSWCWERVAPMLVQEGHTVITPDLEGTGQGGTATGPVTLNLWTAQIVDVVRAQRGPVILVGHSRGGIVISEVAELVPDRIGVLIYLAAFLVPSGSSLAETLGRIDDPEILKAMVPGPNNTTSLNREAVATIFYNKTEAAWQQRAISKVGIEPMEPAFTALSNTPERFGAVSKVYVECEQDKAIPIELQRMMWADTPGVEVRTLSLDHSPFYSDPEELVRTLVECAET